MPGCPSGCSRRADGAFRSLKTDIAKKPRFFYGYWIVLVAFLCLFIQSGIGYFGFSLFVRELQGAMGWGRGEIMAGFTILYLVVGGTAPFIGRVVDRYGARRVIATGALIAGLGFIWLSRLDGLWQFYTGYAIIGAGITAMGQVPTSAVVSNWFKKKRGLAIGIMAMGVGGGGFAMAPLIAGYLIPTFGWRDSYMILAFIVWAVVIPVVLLVLKMRPADMGLNPDGVPDEPVTEGKKPAIVSGGLSLRMAVAVPAFWLISLSFFFSTMSHTAILQNQVPHLEDIGFPVAAAAAALGTVGLCSAVAKLAFGWLCDRILPRYACVIGLGMQVVGVAMLLGIRAESSPALVWAYAIVMGLGVGSWLPTMSMLTSSTFGLAAYGAIFGMVSLAQGVGTAAGPLIAGTMFDIMNTYNWAFILFIALYAIAIPAVLAVRRPRLASTTN